MPVVIIHKEKFAQGTQKKLYDNPHESQVHLIRYSCTIQSELSVVIKNVFWVRGGAGVGGRFIATEKLIKFHLLHPIQ